jgi:hypothetical protein
MISQNALLEHVRQQAVTNNGLVFAPGGDAALDAIFAETLGPYPDYGVFDDPKVMKFIDGQIRRIVMSVRREAGDTPVTGELFTQHAQRVMLSTRQVLDQAMDVAEVELSIGPKRLMASFCRRYLRESGILPASSP